jgi:endonuclease/exonuclease/phosphatase family metal-dependent hydrolase
MAAFRVMTFNILFEWSRSRLGPWVARLPRVVEILRREQPDVAGLQEVSERQAADLARLLPGYQVAIGPSSGRSPLLGRGVRLGSSLALLLCAIGAGAWIVSRPLRDSPALMASALVILGAGSLPILLVLLSRSMHGHFLESGEWCAILFRTDRFRLVREGAFWVSHQPDRPASLLPGTYAPHLVHWVRLEDVTSGHPLTFYNTHLSHARWSSRATAGIVRRHLDRDWDGSPQVLVGDFNASPGSPLLRHLLANPIASDSRPALQDAWREAETTVGPETSFHWGHGVRTWPGRIDHVLVRPALRVTRAATITGPAGGPFASDHDPVTIDFVWPAG